ncbi:hypothetical protein [Luteimonas saliphila]|uniref:hypothetical protein n=1 Tax=Luteimonas saliphila TaxID=2804919 RepID=UPI00192DBAD2|nr:hypothetical protein [Luteimonas saliphila]
MRTAPRRHLSYASLVLLLAADLLALGALVLNQWLEIGPGWSWLLAAGATAALMPALLWLADRVFAAARAFGNVTISGGTIP